MKKSLILAIGLAAILMPGTANAATENKLILEDDFNSYLATNCPKYKDGEKFGPWKVEFNGYGCVRIATDNGEKMLYMRPKAPLPSTNSAETHSTLVTGPSTDGDFVYEGEVSTPEQLRTQPAPNAWETAWVVWNYTDNEHFYYFIPKDNGWELGKRDPKYPGGQRFLATGSQPKFIINQKNKFKITKIGDTVSVAMNGVELTKFTDTERPYRTGSIGLYSEDAAVTADNLKLTLLNVPVQPVQPSVTIQPQPISTPKPKPSADKLAETGSSASLSLYGGVVALLIGLLIGRS